jgi:aarF domain-containing kinase
VITSTSDTSLDYAPNGATGVFDVANVIMRLLPSKDGVALRRLLMTAVSAYSWPLPPLKCRFI